MSMVQQGQPAIPPLVHRPSTETLSKLSLNSEGVPVRPPRPSMVFYALPMEPPAGSGPSAAAESLNEEDEAERMRRKKDTIMASHIRSFFIRQEN